MDELANITCTEFFEKKEIDALISKYRSDIEQICVVSNERLLLGWIFLRSTQWKDLPADIMKYVSVFLSSCYMSVYLCDIYEIIPDLDFNNLGNVLQTIPIKSEMKQKTNKKKFDLYQQSIDKVLAISQEKVDNEGQDQQHQQQYHQQYPSFLTQFFNQFFHFNCVENRALYYVLYNKKPYRPSTNKWYSRKNHPIPTQQCKYLDWKPSDNFDNLSEDNDDEKHNTDNNDDNNEESDKYFAYDIDYNCQAYMCYTPDDKCAIDESKMVTSNHVSSKDIGMCYSDNILFDWTCVDNNTPSMSESVSNQYFLQYFHEKQSKLMQIYGVTMNDMSDQDKMRFPFYNILYWVIATQIVEKISNFTKKYGCGKCYLVSRQSTTKTVKIFNKWGENEDHRGSDHCAIKLPFKSYQQFTICDDCSNDHKGSTMSFYDLINAFYFARSHKFEDWYEMFTGCQIDTTKDDQITIWLNLDHGS